MVFETFRLVENIYFIGFLWNGIFSWINKSLIQSLFVFWSMLKLKRMTFGPRELRCQNCRNATNTRYLLWHSDLLSLIVKMFRKCHSLLSLSTLVQTSELHLWLFFDRPIGSFPWNVLFWFIPHRCVNLPEWHSIRVTFHNDTWQMRLTKLL